MTRDGRRTMNQACNGARAWFSYNSSCTGRKSLPLASFNKKYNTSVDVTLPHNG